MRGPMATVDPVARLAQEIVASYETRVCAVEQVVTAAHEMLDAFGSQQEDTRRRLRECLARTASLRKHDFDAMMCGMLSLQEQRHGRIRAVMRSYLAEQRTSAQALQETMANGKVDRIEDVASRLRDFAGRQELRVREIRNMLGEFRREQEQLASALGGLLSNGASVRAVDLKAALKAIHPCAATAEQPGRAT